MAKLPTNSNELTEALKMLTRALTPAPMPAASNLALQAPVRSRGRPRKDGTPAQPRTQSGVQGRAQSSAPPARASVPPSASAPRARVQIEPSRKPTPEGHGRTDWMIVECIDTRRTKPNYSLVTFKDGDGNIYKWEGSSPQAHYLRPGEIVEASGTILRNEGDVTILHRCWIRPLDT